MIWLLSLLLAFSYGNGVNNGGDAIACSASGENDLHGTYSLDYILTLPASSPAPVSGWSDSLGRIGRLLAAKVPEVAASFEDFRASVFNTEDFTRKRLWETSPYGLIDLKDEKIASMIPENCKAGGKTLIVQAVVRLDPEFSGTPVIIYKFVPEVTERLEREDPVQLSFLLVHEWLWDISGDVEGNRRINRLLHSQEFASMTPAEAKAALKIK